MKTQPRWDSGKAAVCLLIEIQIIGFERVRESEGLLKAETDAVASNRVDPPLEASPIRTTLRVRSSLGVSHLAPGNLDHLGVCA